MGIGMRPSLLWLLLVAVGLGVSPAPAPGGEPPAADGRRPDERSTKEQPRYVRSLEAYRVPPVTLVNQEGEKVALASVLEGDEAVMVNFIFTSCTTICPVMTATVSSMRRALGPAAQALRIVSISIDPAHDTPRALKEYAGRHGIGSGWLLLTGDADQIRPVLKAFGASAGNKTNHAPLTFFKMPGSGQWVRISGFPSAAELVSEYRTAARELTPINSITVKGESKL